MKPNKRIFLAFCVVWILAMPVRAEPQLVKGVLSFSSNGIGQVAECGTHRVLGLGVMASSAYFHFLKQYEAASGIGHKPVLVEVQGEFTKSSDGMLILANPVVVSLAQGDCGTT
jgi:hypothetical protein